MEKDKLRTFSIRFKTSDKIVIFQQKKARNINEALKLAKQIGNENNWKVISVREFSAKKSEEQREPKWSLQALEKARAVGFTNVDFEKEESKISEEEKRLYHAKTEAWNNYKALCSKFYSDYSEALEKEIQDARQKFDFALRMYNEHVRENYNTELGDITV